MAIRLICESENIDRTFSNDLVTIGRGPGNLVEVSSRRVSGIHGQILRRDQDYVYQDLGSTNGSLVRIAGREVVLDGRTRREAAVGDGTTLLLGDRRDPVVVTLEIVDGSPAEQEETRARIAHTVVASRALGDLELVGEELFADTAQRSQLRAVFELMGRLQRRLDPAVHAALMAEFIFDNLPIAAVAGVFFEVDEKRGIVPLLLRTRSSTEPLAIPWHRVEPLLSEAMERRAALMVDDPDLVANRFERVTAGLRCVIACPLVDDEHVRGLVVAVGPERFSQRNLDLLAVVSAQSGLALRNARLVSELERFKGRLEGENEYLRANLEQEHDDTVEIVGSSPALERVLRQVEIVARTDTTVLVLGETGTGKELIARKLHQDSARAERLFATVNCGALTETLLESELFGHIKGAFTGASRDKKGLFEIADGGTLFLDEFGDISQRLQVKLLRVLENGEVTPVGSVKTRRIDVRIVAATNKDLKNEVEAGRFREDLYYRINVFPVSLPPLRDRGTDVRALAEHFLERYAQQFEKEIPGISDATLDRLEHYAWPGNVRELQNEIERAVLLADDGRALQPEDLSERIGGHVELPVKVGPLHDTMARLEAQYIRRALLQHECNRTRTAKTLGISRQALTAKLHKYDLFELEPPG